MKKIVWTSIKAGGFCRGALIVLALFWLNFLGCTAISQENNFLNGLPVPRTIVTVFSENFDNGLGAWSQLAGTWTTGAPAPNGSALISPTSASAATFSIATLNNIDLTNYSGCRLQYDVRYNFSAASGVYGQVLFAGSVVGEFKNTAGTAAISSSMQFLTRTVQLPSGIAGKLTIVTAVATTTTADVRFDNISVTCNNTFPATYAQLLDNFESGGANWSFDVWTISAGAGVGGSAAAKADFNYAGATHSASYIPNINLQGHSGCTLSYYYNLAYSYASNNNLFLAINGLNIRTDVATTPSLVVSQNLAAFEGNATNALYFGCNQPSNNGHAVCIIDNLNLNCQQ